MLKQSKNSRQFSYLNYTAYKIFWFSLIRYCTNKSDQHISTISKITFKGCRIWWNLGQKMPQHGTTTFLNLDCLDPIMPWSTLTFHWLKRSCFYSRGGGGTKFFYKIDFIYFNFHTNEATFRFLRFWHSVPQWCWQLINLIHVHYPSAKNNPFTHFFVNKYGVQSVWKIPLLSFTHYWLAKTINKSIHN